MKGVTLQSRVQLETISETVPELLLQKAKEHVTDGKDIYCIDTISKEEQHYSTFEDSSTRIASYFFKNGMQKGDIVLCMCADIVKFPIFVTGIWRANGILRTAYVDETKDSIFEFAKESKAKWIYCEPNQARLCLSVSTQLGWNATVLLATKPENDNDTDVLQLSSIYDLLQDDGLSCPELKIDGNDTAIILTTSGTTGRCKGAVHTHGSVVALLQQLQFKFCWAETKPNIFLGKTSHLSGSLLPLAFFVGGKQCLVMSKINTSAFFDAVSNYKPGFVFGFPPFIIALANAQDVDKSSIEYVLCGGMSVNPALKFLIQQNFPNLKRFAGIYGLTEIMISTSADKVQNGKDMELLPLPDDFPEGSVGTVFPSVQVQIRDVVSGKVLGPNEIGEICAKGPNMFSGYFNNEHETKLAFTEDGWFKSGDSGYVDEHGYLFHCDRIKEMFKCFTNHVSPCELDDVLTQHPAVENACAVGVPDPNGDKMPRAFVVLKKHASATSAEEIIQFAHEKLAPYKHFRGGLYIVNELPKGSSGKVSRILVAQLPPEHQHNKE